jgi:V8-like Glu-specific endopeptidase
MGTALSNRIFAALAVAASAAGLQALTLPGNTPAGRAVVQAAPDTAAQAAAVRYWTPNRMSAVLRARGAGGPQDAPAKRAPAVRAPTVRPEPAATPPSRDVVAARGLVRQAAPAAAGWLTGDTIGDGLRWTRSGAVAAAVGKVFFTLDREDYVCSGTLVGGAHPDVVLTAAHCVSGGPRAGAAQWATNWLFIPGYTDGQMPYGEYTARRFLVAPGWTGPQGGSEQYDVAFVQVTAPTPSRGTRAKPRPAGLPIEFARSQQAAAAPRGYMFGYPAEPPYSGMYPNYCAGPVTTSGGSGRTSCAMTAGDSGGPWVTGFSPHSGTGTVFAVSTYKMSTNLGVLYGAVLGPRAEALYRQALYRRAVSPAG